MDKLKKRSEANREQLEVRGQELENLRLENKEMRAAMQRQQKQESAHVTELSLLKERVAKVEQERDMFKERCN